uniref:NADH-ubiquinone oxidoreductase chain 1 n=1 Tax=Triraphis sp. QL-2013 TaxID=1421602 RepID=A0A0A6ZL23_9HYME|nr:NADH dehydrogenase subunit 1 [Triraphis sp. QL-2013]
MIKQINFYMMNTLLLMILMLIMTLLSVAFLTLMERKILSYSHYRKGPNKISMMGIMQPFSDAMKLLTKEFFIPFKSNYFMYLMSPMLMFFLIMSSWLVYPFLTNMLNWSLNSIFFLCMMSMGIYGLMISGWASNSAFSMIGAIRSIAQSISYEVTFSISFLISFLMINTLNLNMIPFYQKYMIMFSLLWPVSMVLLFSMLAEINRTPFDLSEGESELVSGFNVEYSSSGFVLIFLSEYASIMFMMFLFNILYFSLNMYSIMFYLTFFLLLFLIIWIRTSYPRIRYDYLMMYCWMYLLPLILMFMMIYMLNLKLPLEIYLFN